MKIALAANLFAGSLFAGAMAAAPQRPAADDPARAFFTSQPVVRVQIGLDDTNRKQLREKPREYASATLQLDGTTFAGVGIKLKGAAGSFREIDDRPGFTVHLGKFGGTERFHGLQRFHLNNCVQDGSRLCEWLGHQVFDAAGLPAPRVAHALVRLDDRALGLYVLREAYDKQFLLRAFGTADGNLYDGGFCQDVDNDLEKDAGTGPDDRTDLRALAALCAGVDQGREAALAAAIDVAGFVDFVAIEAMLGHWDGYSRNANNFRLWLPAGHPAVFLPHGMDQLFGDAEASILDHPPAIVASAVLQQPALRKRYRERLRALLPQFAPNRLRPKLEALAARLRRELEPVDGDAARELEQAARDLVARVEARHRSLQDQVKAPEPKPLQLAVGKAHALVAKLWHPAIETDGLTAARRGPQGVPALQLSAGRREDRGNEPRRGAWRMHVLLAAGQYELQAMARSDGIEPPPNDENGQPRGGVRLRAGDATSERQHGTQPWQPLTCRFEVAEFQRTVELSCEVEAFAGQAWFRIDSLRLVRVE